MPFINMEILKGPYWELGAHNSGKKSYSQDEVFWIFLRNFSKSMKIQYMKLNIVEFIRTIKKMKGLNYFSSTSCDA